MKFSRVISFFVLCVLVIAQVGIPVVSHWCGGLVQERSLVANASCCCNEDDSSAIDDTMMMNDDDSPCCHADTDIARADFSDHVLPIPQTVPEALCVDVVAFFCNTTLFVENPLLPTAFTESAPPDISQPTPALLSVFRI